MIDQVWPHADPELDPELDDAHPDTYDAMRTLKLAKARDVLGPRLRTRVDCCHRYTNAFGERTDPDTAPGHG